jgi:anthranilate synthase/aminodeoxychorismate synthase-like glutamine amidotransferase
MILLIDNYDSFTYNLVQYLGELGAAVDVHRNDKITVDAALSKSYEAIVLSPGPCDPDRAGICLSLIRENAGRIPLLGVCLGHQAIGQAYGGKVIRAPVPVHGKTSAIHHAGGSLFEGLEDGFPATRYHSLIVERATLPNSLKVTAWTDDDLIMGLEHADLPIYGVQFHPESIGTPMGKRLLAKFLALAKTRARA